MRKLFLSLFMALACGASACALDGFDLGDMPPLPPPLLDDSSSGLPPPPSGSLSPLADSPSTGGFQPIAPPLGGGGLPLPPAGTGSDFTSTPLPPAPPPLAPPSLDPPSASPLAPTGIQAGTGSALAPPPLPSATGAAVPAAAAPVVEEIPRQGRITGGRVNVRAGPNTQYESIAVLTTGAPVTVLAKNGDWYKIVFPADQLASIHKNYVNADITGEIPETGLPGVISQNDAPVHAFYWDKSTVVGTLNQGDPVVIKQERGQWYRIDAPQSARAYVFAQYVQVDGGAQLVATDAAPPPANPNVDLTSDGSAPAARKLSEDDRRVVAIKEQYYKKLQEQFEQNLEEEEAAERAAAERRRLQASQLDNALKDLDERLAAIEQETAQRVDHITQSIYGQTVVQTVVGSAAWAPPDPVGGGFTGWVENIGRVGYAPSPYRLTKGGEIRFYLVSDRFNLEEYVGRRVWLNGNVEYAGGASASVLNVFEIRILTELEIAEGMQQSGQPGFQTYDAYQAGQSGQVVGQVYDPYVPPGSVVTTGTPQPYPAGGQIILNPGEVMMSPPMGGQVIQGAPYGDGFVTTPQGTPVQPTGPVPTDPSQLPDVVSSSSSGIMLGGPSMPPAGLGQTLGEVETDIYENPAFSEIGPDGE